MRDDIRKIHSTTHKMCSRNEHAYIERTDFAKVSKNHYIIPLTDLKIILLNLQNNYIRISSMTNNVARISTF